MCSFQSVLLFGAPGAGKGTQGKILGQTPGFFHCASGDVLRSIERDSKDGGLVETYSSRGELVPDEVTVRLWAKAMKAWVREDHYRPTRDLLLLDGIPRTVQQAHILEQHIQVQRIIYLTCKNPQEIIERLRRRAAKENRSDDATETIIRHRWDVYENQTAPVLKYYPKNLIIEIDAARSPGQVLRDILEALVPLQESLRQPSSHTTT